MADKPTAVALTTTTTHDAGELVSRLQSLRDWEPANQTFPSMGLPEVRAAILEVEVALRPIDIRQLAVMLDRTMELWRTPGSPNVMEFYVEALEGFPAFAVAEALKHVRLNHRYPTMPSPADFRSAAQDAAAPLRGTQVRARLAQSRLGDAAKREDRWLTRKPVVVGEGTYAGRSKPEWPGKDED
jgi:hypothetical protein